VTYCARADAASANAGTASELFRTTMNDVLGAW